MKTGNGEAILNISPYYDKNLTTGEETSHYYLGIRACMAEEFLKALEWDI